MSLRKLALIASTAALSLTSVGIGSASGTTLRTDPGNVPFPTGNVTFTNTTSGTVTFTTSIGTFTCSNAKLQATVGNTHAATLTGTLSQLTFTTCTDTIPLLTFSSCHLHGTAPGVAVTANGAGTGGTVSLTDVGLRCGFTSTGGCYFTMATANGVVNNAASTLSYAALNWTRFTGTADNLGSICPASGTLSMVFNHLVEVGTNRTVTITP